MLKYGIGFIPATEAISMILAPFCMYGKAMRVVSTAAFTLRSIMVFVSLRDRWFVLPIFPRPAATTRTVMVTLLAFNRCSRW